MIQDACEESLESLAPPGVQENKAAAVKEETFNILKFEQQQGAKIGEYEAAYKANNIEEKWGHAQNVLRNSNATIKDRYHGQGYQFAYWLYEEGKIYRQKMKPKNLGALNMATEQPKKCVHCGSEITGEGTECYRCLGNFERQQFFKNLKEHEHDPLPKVYPTYATFCDDPEKQEGFKPGRVAKWLFQNEHFKTDRKTEILYYGDGEKGVWLQDGEVKLQELLSKILGEDNKAAHYNNILHDLKGLSYCDIEFSHKIAVDNGLLDVETGELTHLR